jgi:WD40 repeat protein
LLGAACGKALMLDPALTETATATRAFLMTTPPMVEWTSSPTNATTSTPIFPNRCLAGAILPEIQADNVSQIQGITASPLVAVRAMAFSADGHRLAVVHGGTERQGSTMTILCVSGATRETALPLLLEKVWDVAYSPDNRFLASAGACSQSACTVIRDAATGREVRTLTNGNIAYALAFSSDSQLLAVTGTPQEITWLYSTSDWSARTELNPHEYAGYDVAFFPENGKLAVAGIHGEIHFWNTKTGEMLGLLYQTLPAYRLTISPDGIKIAALYCSSVSPSSCTEGRTIVWSAGDGARIAQPTGRHVQAIAFSPDGSLLAIGSGPGDPSLRFYETTTWQLVHTETLETDQLTFSPDGRTLATTDGTTITLWTVG